MYINCVLFCHVSCGVLVALPGIKPMPFALEALRFNHQEILHYILVLFFFFAYSFVWLCLLWHAGSFNYGMWDLVS